MQLYRSNQENNAPQVQTIFFDSVHTADQPYCRDLSCSCHSDVLYHDQVTSQSTDQDEAAYEFALSTLLISRRKD